VSGVPRHPRSPRGSQAGALRACHPEPPSVGRRLCRLCARPRRPSGGAGPTARTAKESTKDIAGRSLRRRPEAASRGSAVRRACGQREEWLTLRWHTACKRLWVTMVREALSPMCPSAAPQEEQRTLNAG